MDRTLLSAERLEAGVAELDAGWTASPECLRRTVEFSSFLAAVGFIGELAPVAERLDHHPDLRLSWRTVDLTLSTHSAGGVTDSDLTLARELDPIIQRLVTA